MRQTKLSLMNESSIAHHRNGISGLGFHVAVALEEDEAERRRMLIVRFPKEADKETGNVVCAVFNLDLLAAGIVCNGRNAWRGDHYHEFIDSEIRKYNIRRSQDRAWIRWDAEFDKAFPPKKKKGVKP